MSVTATTHVGVSGRQQLSGASPERPTNEQQPGPTMRPITRTITCHYEDATGEHEIAVSLWRDGLGHRDWVIETDLSDVPADERESVEQQAIDGWMAADNKAHGVDPRERPKRRGGPSGQNQLSEVKLRAEDDEIDRWTEAASKLGIDRNSFLRRAANELSDGVFSCAK